MSNKLKRALGLVITCMMIYSIISVFKPYEDPPTIGMNNSSKTTILLCEDPPTLIVHAYKA